MGRRISKEFLHPSILEGVNDKIGNLDSLETDAKGNMVQAINELVEKLDNSEEVSEGKELIASAIGEPLNADDTFSDMSSDINGLLSTFKTNMMNSGVTVESGDRFKSLIDKIATMVDNEGKGIQFAEGSLPDKGMQSGSVSLGELDLGFTPTIMILTVDSIYASDFSVNLSNYMFFNLIDSPSTYKHSFQVNSTFTYTVYFEYVDNEIFMHMTKSTGYYTMIYRGMKYYAIGVGEEDTTLRDSLASILQEEGVSVTEGDDIASLITKVDEEFNRQVVPQGNASANQVLQGSTFMNSSGQLQTGTMPEHGNVTYVDKYINYTYDANSVYIGIPLGAYNYPTKDDFAEVYFPKALIPNLSPENIVSGKEILGVNGAALSLNTEGINVAMNKGFVNYEIKVLENKGNLSYSTLFYCNGCLYYSPYGEKVRRYNLATGEVSTVSNSSMSVNSYQHLYDDPTNPVQYFIGTYSSSYSLDKFDTTTGQFTTGVIPSKSSSFTSSSILYNGLLYDVVPLSNTQVRLTIHMTTENTQVLQTNITLAAPVSAFTSCRLIKDKNDIYLFAYNFISGSPTYMLYSFNTANNSFTLLNSFTGNGTSNNLITAMKGMHYLKNNKLYFFNQGITIIVDFTNKVYVEELASWHTKIYTRNETEIYYIKDTDTMVLGGILLP